MVRKSVKLKVIKKDQGPNKAQIKWEIVCPKGTYKQREMVILAP